MRKLLVPQSLTISRIEGATKAMEGIFSMEEQPVQGSEEMVFSAFYFSCESKFPDKSPYAVTLYSPGGESGAKMSSVFCN